VDVGVRILGHGNMWVWVGEYLDLGIHGCGWRILGRGNMLMWECEYFVVGILGCGCENIWKWEYVDEGV